MDTLLTRKSIRKYSSRKIEKDVMDYILSAGVRSSNCGNMQLYSIVVTRDKNIKEKLLPLHFGQKMIMECDSVITVCADINRFSHWCRINGADDILDNFLFLNIATIDATICSQAIATAAEEKGLGICYLGTVNYNAKDIAGSLNLPKGVVPVTCLTVGYPDENPSLTERLPIDAIVHYDTYTDYSNEAIKEYYKSIEENPINRQYVKENNLDNLAQVFAKVRYAKKDNEEFSKKYKAFVNEHFLGENNQI